MLDQADLAQNRLLVPCATYPLPSGYPHYTEKVQCNVSISVAASLPVQELQIFHNHIKQHTPTTEKHLKVNAQIKLIKQLQSASFSQADQHGHFNIICTFQKEIIIKARILIALGRLHIYICIKNRVTASCFLNVTDLLLKLQCNSSHPTLQNAQHPTFQ